LSFNGRVDLNRNLAELELVLEYSAENVFIGVCVCVCEYSLSLLE